MIVFEKPGRENLEQTVDLAIQEMCIRDREGTNPNGLDGGRADLFA